MFINIVDGPCVHTATFQLQQSDGTYRFTQNEQHYHRLSLLRDTSGVEYIAGFSIKRRFLIPHVSVCRLEIRIHAKNQIYGL